MTIDALPDTAAIQAEYNALRQAAIDAQAALEKRTQRDVNGHFAPGNKLAVGSGRPAGLAQLVRRQTRNGELLVEIMLDIAQAKVAECRTADRVSAVEWLADRGWGKAAQIIQSDSTSQVTIRVIRDGDVVDATPIPSADGAEEPDA